MHGNHFGDILSGSFLTPNHDSNLYIRFLGIRRLVNIFHLRPMNIILTYVAVLESESNNNINIFTRKLPAIHFACFSLRSGKMQGMYSTRSPGIIYNFSCFYQLEFNASHTVTF